MRNMSICYTEVENSPLLKKAFLFGAREFIRAKIDPATTRQLSLPNNYQFSECFMPKRYIQLAIRIQNFPIYPNDVWVVSFMKAGTTWTTNIVWQLRNGLDFSANIIEPSYMFPDRGIFYDTYDDNRNDEAYQKHIDTLNENLVECEKQAPPRILKSHLPASLLPKNIWTVKPKLIYVYRDARDVAISMYHMHRNHLWHRYPGTMENFFDAFLNDHVIYGPFYSHVNSFKQLSQLDHVLLVEYDEMLENPFAGVKRISEFLNCKYSDDQLKQLTEHLSFRNMRNKNQEYQNCLSSGFK